MNKSSNWLLILAVVALAIVPLIFVQGEYGGADGEAQKAITEIQPSYKPWFNNLFQPPSKEVESLLFVSQAALGAGIFGYVIGRYQSRSK